MSDTERLNLRDLDVGSLRAAVGRYGVDEVRAGRIFSRVHRHGATTLEGVVGLGREVRRALERDLVFPDLQVIERRQAADGFVKYLFRLADGPAIEAVRLPLPSREDAQALKQRRLQGQPGALEALPVAKYVVCVSSQAGCALACDFCATGRLGAIRNLRTWEILAQVRHVAADADRPVRGVVFMGMGEPFLNYDNVVRAANILCEPAGMAIAAKAITISTAGVVPMIRRFTAEGLRFRLIVSLGAPTSEERLRLMPIERRWPLPELMEAIRAYATSMGRRVTLAYVGIGGHNLTPRHARQLIALVGGLRVRISLISVVDESGQYPSPTEDEVASFRDELSKANIHVVRRYSGGGDIGAACGTLSASQKGGQLVSLR